MIECVFLMEELKALVYLFSEKTLATERITIINASYYLVANQCLTRIFSVVEVLSNQVILDSKESFLLKFVHCLYANHFD